MRCAYLAGSGRIILNFIKLQQCIFLHHNSITWLVKLSAAPMVENVSTICNCAFSARCTRLLRLRKTFSVAASEILIDVNRMIGYLSFFTCTKMPPCTNAVLSALMPSLKYFHYGQGLPQRWVRIHFLQLLPKAIPPMLLSGWMTIQMKKYRL